MAQDSPQTKYTSQNILNNVYDQLLKTLATTSYGWNGQQAQANNADSLALQLDYNGGANPIYLGIAAPGTTTAQALWQIRKLTFDGNNNVTAIKYANGSSSFDQVYDDRVSLTYS